MRAWALCLLLCGCGDDDGGTAAADARPGFDAGPPSFGRAPATIEVYANQAGGESWTEGTARIASEPWPDPYTEAEREGSCRRLVSQVPFCDPPCETGLCTAPNVCTPYPAARSAGTITLAGGGGQRTLSPPDYLGFSVPGALFGQEVTASAPGADYPGFTLSAPLGEPLVLADASLQTAPGVPLVLDWTPGGDPEARIYLELIADRGHAMVHPSVIECDLPDAAGHLRVPQAMADAHGDPANWSCGDCFTSRLVRYRRAATTTAEGEVELWAGSRVSIFAVPFAAVEQSLSGR
jgi:hypothetical protein